MLLPKNQRNPTRNTAICPTNPIQPATPPRRPTHPQKTTYPALARRNAQESGSPSTTQQVNRLASTPPHDPTGPNRPASPAHPQPSRKNATPSKYAPQFRNPKIPTASAFNATAHEATAHNAASAADKPKTTTRTARSSATNTEPLPKPDSGAIYQRNHPRKLYEFTAVSRSATLSKARASTDTTQNRRTPLKIIRLQPTKLAKRRPPLSPNH